MKSIRDIIAEIEEDVREVDGRAVSAADLRTIARIRASIKELKETIGISETTSDPEPHYYE